MKRKAERDTLVRLLDMVDRIRKDIQMQINDIDMESKTTKKKSFEVEE